MRKLYLTLVALVPAALAALSGAGFAQSNPGGTPPPGMTGDPAMNSPQGERNSPSNVPNRARHPGTMNNRAMKNSGMSNGTPSAPDDAAGQSIAPGSAPKGSDEPQTAKPRPRQSGPMDSDTPSSSQPPAGSEEAASPNRR